MEASGPREKSKPCPQPPSAAVQPEEASKKRPPVKRREYGESWEGDNHGEWKDAMNVVFGKGVQRITQEHGNNDLVLVLDDNNEPAGGFGTSRCLHEQFEVPVEALRIVQYDAAKAKRMQANSVYGSRVFHNCVKDHLRTSDDRYRALYLDLCGTWSVQLRPSLEALFARRDALPADGSPLLLGVTWCTRESSGLRENECAHDLVSMLLSHASVTQICVSKFGQMRTHFYELTRIFTE